MKIKDFKIPLWGNIFDRFTPKTQEEETEILKRIPIFSELTRRELKQVAKIMYDRSFEVGEYIFETGQPGAAMFIIKEGLIQINKINADAEELTLASLGSGEFLGELALLDNSPRSASAFVAKPTKTHAIFRSDLEKLLKSNPELGAKVMRHLAIVIGMRLKATNDLLIEMEQKGNESV